VPQLDRFLAPMVLLLGETVTETLTAQAVCAAEAFPTHIVVVLDGSTAQSAAVRHDELDLAVRVVIDLRLEEMPMVSVGGVVFGGVEPVSCRLTNDAARVRRCLRRVLDEPSPDADVDDLGLDAAMEVLRDGRERMSSPDSYREIIVLVTDARCLSDCRTAERARHSAASRGILMIGACASGQCDRTCVRRLAASQRYFVNWPSPPGAIYRLIEPIFAAVLKINIKRITIVGDLPPGAQIVPGSADPPPEMVSADGRTLTWVFPYVPQDGATVTLRLRPLGPGYGPLGLAARAELLDNQNRLKEVVFGEPIPAAVMAPAEPSDAGR
jgi:hypothetical protein